MPDDFPSRCCKNVAHEAKRPPKRGFLACRRKATHWYRHYEDHLCSYCDKHNYQCGEEVFPPKGKEILAGG